MERNARSMKKSLCLILASAVLLAAPACSHGGAEPQPSSSVSSEAVSSAPSSAASGTESGDLSSAAGGSSSPAASGPAKEQGASSPAKTGGASSAPAAPSQPEAPKTVSVVIPEGFTLSQIGDRLEAKGVCKKADLIKSAQTYDFSYYPLVKAIKPDKNRCYKLEGYLYPDTYEFYVNMKPEDAVGKFLRNAESNITDKYKYAGMTTDQVVTLASIIEREADNPDDMKKVSSVFHNRLKIKQRLEADATIVYIESFVKPNIGGANTYNAYYNTYKCPALPAGPICNPGAAALNAAAHPADTDYYYFITANGQYYYQKTLEEHDQKLKELGLSTDSSAS